MFDPNKGNYYYVIIQWDYNYSDMGGIISERYMALIAL